MDKRLQQAIAYREAEQYEAAEQLLQILHREQPDNAEVQCQMAWLLDTQGREREAVPYYEQAIALGLEESAEKGALLGLGSTYRCLGAYEKAVKTLTQGQDKYPESKEFAVFLAMALYNLQAHQQAMELLLRAVGETSADRGVQRYRRAILFYADKLDAVFE